MSTITLIPVKRQLEQLLAARPGLAGVQVMYRWAGDSKDQEAIWFGNTSGSNTYPVMRAGRKPRDEQYVVNLHLEVQCPDSADETSEARALELLAELEDLVADDPALGLSGTFPTLVAELASWSVTNGLLDPAGWGTHITAQIEVKSRLT